MLLLLLDIEFQECSKFSAASLLVITSARFMVPLELVLPMSSDYRCYLSMLCLKIQLHLSIDVDKSIRVRQWNA